MHSPNACTGQHRNDDLGDHRHVDGDTVTLLDSCSGQRNNDVMTPCSPNSSKTHCYLHFCMGNLLTPQYYK